MIDVVDLGLDWYVKRFNDSEPFSLARYGDGEWSSIVENRPTCLGQSLRLRGLKDALIESIVNAHNDPRFVMACHPNQAQGNIEIWLKRKQPKWLQWADNRTFYKASKNGRLCPFIRALRETHLPLVIVGPRHLRGLSNFLKISNFVEIPQKDCFSQFSTILKKALLHKPAVYSISAGLASSPLVYQMFKYTPDSFILDLGSLWDIYVGVWSRSYHSEAKRKMKENLCLT